MASNDFLVWDPTNTNKESQATYAADGARTNGVASGTASSSLANKTWAQSSIIAAMIGQFIANISGQNAVDDGTTATLLTNFELALATYGGWVALGTTTIAASAATTILLPTAYRRFRLTIQNGVVSTAGNAILCRLSSNGGSSFLSTSNYTYVVSFTDSSPATNIASSVISPSMFLTPVLPANNTGGPVDMVYNIWPGTSTAAPRFTGTGTVVDSPGLACTCLISGSWGGTAALFNALQLLVGSGTFSCTAILEGQI